MMKLVLVILIVALASTHAANLGCMNEDGQPVDWWVISKQPPIKTEPENSPAHNGVGYSYADATSPALVMSTRFLNETNALSYTLEPLYKTETKSNPYLWLMYNDQPTGISVPSSYAHSKGVIGFSDSQGFWLIHSVPQFPTDPHKGGYGYPESGHVNGQSFLCVTYGSSEFDAIVQTLYVNRPYAYSSLVPTGMTLPLSQLDSFLSGGYESTATGSAATLKSIGGQALSVFYKNLQWNNDLYEELVQPRLDQNMVVTSWRIGANSTIMPSFCKPEYKYDSVNSLTLQIKERDGNTVSWKYTKDHSKWAASMPTEATKYICIGDINRMYSQYKRGGGTACLAIDALWQSYYDTIDTVSGC
ncbi:hypothetical protein SAMD00019534_005840 [Acytostelium subglobosum LB1]|uniref:hypothetical protein n=1 Tax=Acytostelium subglobosum LB1 TaxID=1410327 RepID=UPI000644AFA3|nr:hypothetical protein SAMD00019534_005840 [Acytostelium subglobosum LB1]GAM17409.1 hypothetical protein SAMD00019534_005840 [Acytostelium subglobosum LB1]|eukprot:XP_012759471.1 hypothetical protein SAMD00019534_005840 [Acytostelium subglobosum LB1]